MLQSLRENLKGAVAVFVLLIFIVPLVLFGVEQLFVGSVGGTEAATVNGEGVNARDLQREIVFDKMRLQQQFDLPSTDPKLDDSNLRGPALTRMVQRLALFQAAQDGAMGASKDALWKDIVAEEGFKTDGKFDYNLFKQRISNFYTPATYLDASAKDYVLRQLNTGLTGSTFTTEADVALIASITQQKRTFYSIDIPKASVNVEVTDEEIEAHYTDNSERYMEPETATVEYIELSLDALAENNQPSESDVKATYELEVSEFKADPKYQVAHILIEAGDEAEGKVAQVAERLGKGDAFEELAKEFSDDIGSKELGGSLGLMVEDAFPSEFVEAAKALSVGAVSSAVATEAGTHFIKLLEVSNSTPPSFEERKEALTNQLAKLAAQEEFATKMATMDEFTFGAESLKNAADKLGLTVQMSAPFTRSGGSGVAANKEVVSATYADDVLKQAQNSRVIELPGSKAVVVRLKEHKAAALKPLETVKASIKTELTAEKTNALLAEKAESLKASLVAGADAESVAKEQELEYALYEDTKRNNFDVDRSLISKAFSLSRPSESVPVVDGVSTPKGYSVVGLLSVVDGKIEDLSEQELTGLKGQLAYQLGQLEMTVFEDAVVSSADIDMSN